MNSYKIAIIFAIALIIALAASKYSSADTLMNKHMTSAEKAERVCLATNIYFEARNQSTAGHEYIGYVTMNRLKHSKFPNNICKVIWQNAQFSWTHDGKPDTIYNIKAWKRAVMAGNYVINNPTKDPTKGSLYYHAKYVKPYWAAYMQQVAILDDHIFYIDK
jgi:N-acetylmuramoyl-L-alanine amidase